MERLFTYFSIKFDNLYLKWNFLRIWLWKWKKRILFYERSPSKIILIENTKLFFLFFFGCVSIYNLSYKKCVYIIKKCAYMYIYVCGSCFDTYISVALNPSKQKFLTPPWDHTYAEASLHYYLQLWQRGCGQIGTWVWFWRRNRSTILWSYVHHRQRHSPGRANRLQAVENQHSQKRHLHDFREIFLHIFCSIKNITHKFFFFSMWQNMVCLNL